MIQPAVEVGVLLAVPLLQGVHADRRRDRSMEVVHWDVDGEPLSVAFGEVCLPTAVHGGGDDHIGVLVRASAERDESCRGDGRELVQRVGGIAAYRVRGAVLRESAVSDAVVGIAEGAVLHGRSVRVHALAGDHLREAVVSVAPRRAVGKTCLRPSVVHVETIAHGTDFAVRRAEGDPRDVLSLFLCSPTAHCCPVKNYATKKSCVCMVLC